MENIKLHKHSRILDRKETYSIDDVLQHINLQHIEFKHIVDFDSDSMKMNSQRYQLFKRDGCSCVTCGLTGTYFIKEKFKNNFTYHFNLYGMKDNEEILFTKDHIYPKSKGGKDNLDNYQVMCEICNTEKGNKII